MTTETKLREALQAGPTKGPWIAHVDQAHRWPLVMSGGSTGHIVANVNPESCPTHDSAPAFVVMPAQTNANYIAAANPVAIRALLDELDQLRALALPAQPAREPVDDLGMPTSCGKPLCSPGDHHPLCKLHEPEPMTDERDSFELAMRERCGWGHSDFLLNPFDRRDYAEPCTDSAWSAWQARASMPPPAREPMTEDDMLTCMQDALMGVVSRVPEGWRELIRAVEAHHNIRPATDACRKGGE